MNNISVYEMAWGLFSARVKPEEIGKSVGKDRSTIYRWLKGIKYRGIRRFVAEKKTAKRSRKRKSLDTLTVVRIKAIRDQYGWCGEKIAFWLEEKYGKKVAVKSIYRVLARYYNLRSKWKKNKYRGKPPKAEKPRDVIQADTVDLGELFAYTAVDLCSREASVVIGDSLESQESASLLPDWIKPFGAVSIWQSDEGSEFKDKFAKAVKYYSQRHRYSRPGKKNDQAYIESFNRTFRKQCVGWRKYKRKDKPMVEEMVKKFLILYNTIQPHLGINLRTPREEYLSHLQ